MTDILRLLHDPLLGREAAIALGSIADDSDRVLSKENFAVLRVSPSFRLLLSVAVVNEC